MRAWSVETSILAFCKVGGGDRVGGGGKRGRYYEFNVGVVSKVSCSFYPCNAHRRNVKFLESWGCTYNPTLH